MGKTRDLFKKIRDTKGTFHAKMDTIKDRNRDFSLGPVAKTLSSQCRGPKFNPWSENKISHAATKTWCSQINKY